jgi:hypothetical protein
MKEFIAKIWTSITSNDGLQKFILLAVAVFAFCMWFQTCSSKKADKAEAERQSEINAQNLRAMKDSIVYVKNKAGDIEAVKSSFVTQISDLKKMNSDLFNETKKEIGNLRAIIKGSVTEDIKDVVISNSVKQYPGGIYGLKFNDTKTDSGMTWLIDGETKFQLENNTIFPGKTEIYNNQIQLKVVLGFKETDKNYEVFARSSSPFVKFDSLSGALLIPKKGDITCPPPARNKRWGLGVQIGYGIGLFNKQVYVTPYVGVGVQYNFLRW